MNEVKKNKLSILPIENLSMNRNIYFVYADNFTHIDLLNELSKIYSEINLDIS